MFSAGINVDSPTVNTWGKLQQQRLQVSHVQGSTDHSFLGALDHWLAASSGQGKAELFEAAGPVASTWDLWITVHRSLNALNSTEWTGHDSALKIGLATRLDKQGGQDMTRQTGLGRRQDWT